MHDWNLDGGRNSNQFVITNKDNSKPGTVWVGQLVHANNAILVSIIIQRARFFYSVAPDYQYYVNFCQSNLIHTCLIWGF